MARVEIQTQAWGWVTDEDGNPLSGETVTIENTDSTAATHYSAITGGSSSTASISTNANGTIPRYLEEGSYDVTVNGETHRVEALNAAERLLNVHTRQEDTGTGHGPFTWQIDTNEYESVTNPVMHIGYNAAVAGVQVDEDEPMAFYSIEADYSEASVRTMEAYLQFETAAGLSVRPFFWQVKRDAATHATFITRATVAGNPFNICGPDGDTVYAEVRDSVLEMKAPNTGLDTTIRAKAATGRGSVLSLGANGSDDIFKFSAVSATSAVIEVGGRQLIWLWSQPLGAAGQAISVGVQDNSAVGVFDVGASNIAVKGVVARGRSGQTGSLFEVQDSTTAAMWLLDASGIPRWVAAANQQTTVGSAGGASALPATPTKYLKVKDSAGTTLVIPAYAA